MLRLNAISKIKLFLEIWSGQWEDRSGFDHVWTLTPKDNGTELLLEHTDFKEIDDFKMYSAVNEGWLVNIKKIADLLNKVIKD